MMNKLYRESFILHPALQWLIAAAVAIAYYLCCLPSFRLIGHFTVQILLSILFSLICTAGFFVLLPRSLTVIGKGLSLFLLGILAKTMFDQIVLQIQAGRLSWWQYTFFYDKPMIVSFVWAVGYVSLMLLRLSLPMKNSPPHFMSDYTRFFRDSTGVFLFFYVCVRIYCFILQREPGGEAGVNLVPFAMIAEYFQVSSASYENRFYFLGNLLCFFPFGFFLRVFRVKTDMVRIILIPLVCSVVIEAAQLLLNMGHFDIDDILMNAFGFYFGYFLSYLLDLARTKISAGEEQTIFALAEHN